MHYRRERRDGRRRRGAAAAELALIGAPILALILVASADFARLFWYYETVTDCANNGALYGCQDAARSTDSAGIQAAALTDAAGVSPQPGVSSSTGSDADGNPYVAVKVTYPFSTLVPYPGIPSPVNLSRTVQMRVAQVTPN
jgi:Flp pilus assembly protein TadG